jgi:DNA-directed RNA polymerase subunit RPC12/RpoP
MAKIVGMGGEQGEPTQGGNTKIDLGKSRPIVCGECGYDTFVDGAKFRRISKLITGTPQDVIVPIDVYLCANCGEMCGDLLPEQMKVLEELDKKRNEG